MRSRLTTAERLTPRASAILSTAATIGAGELDHQITISTGDELEALADEFNRMNRQLEAAFAGLTKEREMPEAEKKKVIKEFSFTKGMLVATFSGIMSACFAFALRRRQAYGGRW